MKEGCKGNFLQLKFLHTLEKASAHISQLYRMLIIHVVTNTSRQSLDINT